MINVMTSISYDLEDKTWTQSLVITLPKKGNIHYSVVIIIFFFFTFSGVLELLGSDTLSERRVPVHLGLGA